MSAMFVSRHDIDLLVSAMRETRSLVRTDGRYDHADRVDPNALGRLLWAENVKSLRYRYPIERDEHHVFDREAMDYAFTEYRGVKPGPIGHLTELYAYQTASTRTGARAPRSSPSANCGLSS